MVSFSDSPFVTLVLPASENPITLAPSRLAAVSKLNLVLVEGSKKMLAITFPLKIGLDGFFSNSFASFKVSRISSRE